MPVAWQETFSSDETVIADPQRTVARMEHAAPMRWLESMHQPVLARRRGARVGYELRAAASRRPPRSVQAQPGGVVNDLVNRAPRDSDILPGFDNPFLDRLPGARVDLHEAPRNRSDGSETLGRPDANHLNLIGAEFKDLPWPAGARIANHGRGIGTIGSFDGDARVRRGSIQVELHLTHDPVLTRQSATSVDDQLRSPGYRGSPRAIQAQPALLPNNLAVVYFPLLVLLAVALEQVHQSSGGGPVPFHVEARGHPVGRSDTLELAIDVIPFLFWRR